MDELLTPPYLFLGQPYLARSFTEITRQKCFLLHEAIFHSALKESLLEEFRATGLSLVERSENGNLISVRMLLTPIHRGEGELSLDFLFNNQALYTLSFSIIPGPAVGLSEPETLLIGRMQGYKRVFELFREATKALGDVSPQAALIAAVEGVARAFALKHMVGVEAENCCGYKDAQRLESLENAYNAFYLALGAEAVPEGFFRLTVPLPKRPASAAKPGHRIRTRRKQEIKQQISNLACQSLRAAFEENFALERDATAASREALGSSAQALDDWKAQIGAEIQELKAQNAALVARNAELERERAERLGAPRGLIRKLLESRFLLSRRLGERLEMRRLRLRQFDEGFYLAHNGDMQRGGARAILHYVRHGRRERREARFRDTATASKEPTAAEL